MLIADLENEKFKLIEFCLFDYNFTPKILDTNQIHVLGKNDDDNLQSIVLDESGAILVNKLHKVESEKDVRIAPYVYTNSDRVNNHFYSIGVLQFFYTQQEIQSYVGVFQFDEKYPPKQPRVRSSKEL